VSAGVENFESMGSIEGTQEEQHPAPQQDTAQLAEDPTSYEGSGTCEPMSGNPFEEHETFAFEDQSAGSTKASQQKSPPLAEGSSTQEFSGACPPLSAPPRETPLTNPTQDSFSKKENSPKPDIFMTYESEIERHPAPQRTEPMTVMPPLPEGTGNISMEAKPIETKPETTPMTYEQATLPKQDSEKTTPDTTPSPSQITQRDQSTPSATNNEHKPEMTIPTKSPVFPQETQHEQQTSGHKNRHEPEQLYNDYDPEYSYDPPSQPYDVSGVAKNSASHTPIGRAKTEALRVVGSPSISHQSVAPAIKYPLPLRTRTASKQKLNGTAQEITMPAISELASTVPKVSGNALTVSKVAQGVGYLILGIILFGSSIVWHAAVPLVVKGLMS